MRLKPFMLLSGLAALLAVPAQADPAFVLTPAAQSGVGSNEVFFTGAFTNTNLAGNLFLNNIQFSFTNQAGNYLAGNSNVFYGNVPGILLPGGTYSDMVFGITIASNTPPGQYFGTVTIQGGGDIFAGTNLAAQGFEVTLPAAALGITLSGTNVALSWPSPPGSWTLQQNSDLTTTNWTAATNNTATVANGQAQTILAPTNVSLFYRLVYP
jgi:hypothetical protein